MLNYFSVENYRNFKEKIEIRFDNIRNYNFNEQCIRNGMIKNAILYGKNASGKTNLSLALLDVVNHISDKEPSGLNRKAGFINADNAKLYATFCYVFKFDDNCVKYSYKKDNNQQLAFEELYFDNEKIFEYDFVKYIGNFDGVKISVNNTLVFPEKMDISVLKYIAGNSILNEDSLIKKTIKFITNMVWLRSLSVNNYVGANIGETTITDYLINHKLVKKFEEFLNKCDIKENLEVQIEPAGSKTIYFKKARLIPFSVSASSGTIALAMLYIWFSQIDNLSFVWIDEFDAFYHYELAEKIIEMLEEKNCQVFVSSHNTSLLTNKTMRPDTYFILSDGKLKSLCDATTRELREGHNLEKLYVNGEFDNEKNTLDS